MIKDDKLGRMWREIQCFACSDRGKLWRHVTWFQAGFQTRVFPNTKQER